MTAIYRSEAAERRIQALYDGLLSRWPVPYEGLRIPTRHGETFVIASGERSAPPLVLLHGSCSNALSWGGDVSAYARDFRVFSVDIIGEAGRSAPSRPPTGSAAYEEWLGDLFDGLGLATAHLLGYSMGGWMAAQFAARHPERLGRLVLMAPGGITQPCPSFLFAAVFSLLLGKRGVPYMRKVIAGPVTLPEEADEIFEAIGTGVRPRGAIPLLSDEELRRLTMPVLLVSGVEDAVQPAAKIAKRLKRFLPRLQVELLPRTGHLLLETTRWTLPFLLGEEAGLSRGDEKGLPA